MEPRQATPEQISQPEALGQDQVGHERALSHLTEISVGSKVEREIAPQPSAANTANAAQAATAVVPAIPLPTPVQDDAATTDSGTPLVAADEDLIEKEWVDKAKKIILETKDDPYRREQEVKKIQIDYVRKRYGRIIGDSGDD